MINELTLKRVAEIKANPSRYYCARFERECGRCLSSCQGDHPDVRLVAEVERAACDTTKGGANAS